MKMSAVNPRTDYFIVEVVMNMRAVARPPLLSAPVVFAILSVMAFPTRALAQEKPLPEHQRLASWVGEWTYVAGEESGTVVFEWFGDFFVRSDAVDRSSSEGSVRVLQIFGYDAEERVYTLDRYVDSGYRDAAKGRVQGNTWTFVFDESAEGQWRVTVVEESPGFMTYKWERSIEGGPWEVASEGRMTKAT